MAVPAAWAAVWLPAAQRVGAVIVGDAEWRACSAAAGEPVFPDDFPAAPAYGCGAGAPPTQCRHSVHIICAVCAVLCLFPIAFP